MDLMLSHMTPQEFVERMVYAKLANERPEDPDEGGMIAADDPDFERKFLGRAL